MNNNEHEYLGNFSSELEKELVDDILPYWIKHSVDHKNGGFYGRITFDNLSIKEADKGSILNSRILWTFSAAYKKFRKPEYKKIADHAYQYLVNAFLDPEYGGVYWMLDAEGNPADSRKHVYAQAFAIYSLTEYYNASEADDALSLAKQLFSLIESNCSDSEYGGYYEAFTYHWQLMDDVRLSDKDRNEPKSMNTHLHVLEAYTNLYRYWAAAELKKSLTNLLDIFADHIVNKEKSSLHNFLSKDWAPRSDEISYGHNIEASWLLLEASEVVGDYSRKKLIEKICLSLSNLVKEEGVDPEFGGIYNEANSEGLTDDNKDYWPQTEAIVGFMNAYQISGDRGYLQAAYDIWKFIKAHIIDHNQGEWHEKVTRSGVPYRLDKVQPWKCPYHSSRAVLEILRRKNQLQEKTKNEETSSTRIEG